MKPKRVLKCSLFVVTTAILVNGCRFATTTTPITTIVAIVAGLSARLLGGLARGLLGSLFLTLALLLAALFVFFALLISFRIR